VPISKKLIVTFNSQNSLIIIIIIIIIPEEHGQEGTKLRKYK